MGKSFKYHLGGLMLSEPLGSLQSTTLNKDWQGRKGTRVGMTFSLT